jgi:hypothetical protein
MDRQQINAVLGVLRKHPVEQLAPGLRPPKFLLVCSIPIIAQLDLQHLENLSGQLARSHFNTQKRMPP